jgi:GNAT superfamily N-acetyltransferase
VAEVGTRGESDDRECRSRSILEQWLSRASIDDVAAVTALKQAAYAHNRTLLGVEPLPLLIDYREVLADPAKETWLARAGGRPTGALVLAIRRGDLLIESIAIDPRAQGGGLGRRLLEATIERARELGRPTVRLYTGSPLAHLIAWYGRHGFVVEQEEVLTDRRITHMKRDLR